MKTKRIVRAQLPGSAIATSNMQNRDVIPIIQSLIAAPAIYSTLLKDKRQVDVMKRTGMSLKDILRSKNYFKSSALILAGLLALPFATKKYIDHTK